MSKPENLTIEGARIIFRNFTGRPSQFNAEGDRNFHVVLEEEQARQLEADGWTVRWPKARPDLNEDEDTRQPTLPVTVKYRNRLGEPVMRPPRVYMITGRNRVALGEGEVELLDDSDIQNVDLIVRPFDWEFAGRSGISAYLQTLYVTVQLDPLAAKYEALEMGDE